MCAIRLLRKSPTTNYLHIAFQKKLTLQQYNKQKTSTIHAQRNTTQHNTTHITSHEKAQHTLTDDARADEAEPLAGDGEDSAALQRGDEPVYVHHVGRAAHLVLGAHHLWGVECVVCSALEGGL